MFSINNNVLALPPYWAAHYNGNSLSWDISYNSTPRTIRVSLRDAGPG